MTNNNYFWQGLALSLFFLLIGQQSQAQATETVYLSGTSKDDTKIWDFYCSEGMNSGKWTTIPVPSCWELQGFGHYNYGRHKKKYSEYGLYKTQFSLPNNWKDKQINIVFEGVMTDAEVKINGQLAGPIHQGAFYEFSYDVTKLLRSSGTNTLEVKVNKASADTSVNKAEREADYWIFGGIFRPVRLVALPKNHISKLALDAQADGKLSLQCTLAQQGGMAAKIVAQVTDLNGQSIGNKFEAAVSGSSNEVKLQQKVEGIKAWNPEQPTLYFVKLQLLDKQGNILHQTQERFGFRTIDLRPRDGIYVNNQKIMFKGVNRHSFWPTSGRTTSKALSIMDVNLMKDMNMNAVRMSHYPPDKHFLEVCDSLGLFVLDELSGWQDFYDTEIGKKLIREMVERDRNHPCIILWDNGNEGGHNYALSKEYHNWDLQKRPVIHPWEQFGHTDTQHYRPYNYGPNSLFQGREIFFPTEFLHALYDGGGGAGLEDYWKLMRSNPLSAGGFIWALVDECVVRRDRRDSLDGAFDQAPDGLVGPYREKEGSFFAVKEIWSPVYIEQRELEKHFNGKLKIENRYHFSNLNQVKFSWRLLKFKGPRDPKTFGLYKAEKSGEFSTGDVAAGESKLVDLGLPADYKNFDGLEVKITDWSGREVYTFAFMLKSPEEIAQPLLVEVAQKKNKPSVKEKGNLLEVSAGKIKLVFSKENGTLTQVFKDGKLFPLADGPVLAIGKVVKPKFSQRFNGNNLQLEFNEGGDLVHHTWEISPQGRFSLSYNFKYHGETPYLGLNFSLPDSIVNGITYLGRGPYRVWKNRLRGAQYGMHQKKYNDTRTGWEWNFPEFKGYHGNMYWADIETKNGNLTIVNEAEDVFLRLLTPKYASINWNKENTQPPFPKGDIGVMHAIPPVGTKFLKPEKLGPSGQPTELFDTQYRVRMKGKLHFTIN